MSQLPVIGPATPRLTLAATTAPARQLTPISPVDLKPLPPLPVATTEEILAAVSAARLAQARWGRVSFDERARALRAAAKELLRRRGEAAALAREEMGKVAAEGLFNEGLGPVETMSAWIEVVATQRWRQVRLNPLSFAGKRAEVELVPRGVVGILAPWNFPVAGLYRAIFPALLLGNAVILKPSEYTPRTSAWLIDVLSEFLPGDLVQVVQGDGEIGAALIDAGIDACVFTGSPEAGAKVAASCARRGIPSSLEMGGKDAAIVFEDCDLDRTVAGLTQWALSNAGQSCGAIEIVYAERAVADRLVSGLADAFRRLRWDGTASADVAPLANRRQHGTVAAQVAEARAAGATIVCGGVPALGGLGYAPTVLDHCTAEMSIVRDETFGPVIAVVRVSGAEDAIRQINASRYGLGASIWSRDLARARRLADRLEVGVVVINNHSFTGAIPALPWSGTKATGHGVANGPEALSTFARPRTVVTDSSTGPEAFWMPYDETLTQLGELLADAQLGRLGQAWRIPLLLRKRIRTVRKFFRTTR